MAWWPALSTWTSWITIVGVALAFVALIKPRYQNWIISRSFYFSKCFAREMVIRDNIPLNGHWENMKFKWQIKKLRIFAKLSPMNYRLSFAMLVDVIDEELKNNSKGGIYTPKPDTNATIMEIAAYYEFKTTKKKEKELLRQHKGIRCAGGCGTKYGKRHKNQGFLGKGVNNSGWLYCDESCTPESRIDHYCGMCQKEREQQQTLSPSDTVSTEPSR